MNNQILKNITIPKGAYFSECGQSISGEWEDCSNLGLINNANGYTGEFRMATLGNNVAAFASPSFVSCDGPTVEKKDCIIELKFNQDQVRLLIDKQVPIESLLQPPVVNSSGLISTTQNLESSMSSPSVTKTTTQPSECDSIFKCSLDFVAANWLLLFSSLVILFLLVLFKDKLYRFIFADDRTKPSRQPRRTTATNSSSRLPKSVESLSSSDIINRLDSIDQKLKSFDSKLNDIDIRLLDLEQSSTSNLGQSFSNKSGVVSPSSGVLEKLSSPASSAVPSTSLSIDLVKQAVAQMDYSLIASHSHLFLNEMQESREGKFERRRFDVLGDQSQSSSFANAEFIGISVGSQTYLIPNILANAADPRRTMKRHVDSNSIYRAGAGPNMLKISNLAILQRLSSSSFELAQIGSIE